MVCKRIQKLGTPDISVLYLDGDPTEEKKETHEEREQARSKALENADKAVQYFAYRVDNNLRIRKQHFTNVEKQLNNAFRWDPAHRHSLAVYLRYQTYNVVELGTEANVRIAQDCIPGDITISGDSGLAIHSTITTIWRVLSGDRFLESNMDDVLSTLCLISRNHLVILGIVSHNDHNRNIYGLGCATNFEIM